MTTVEQLAARAEIADLLATYCIAFDDQDWETFAELWTEDASFVVEEHAFHGRQVLLDFLTTCLPQGYVSKHMISQPLITFSDDGQTARAWTDVVWIAANFRNAIVGRYVDVIVQDRGRWRFRRREEIPVPYRAGPTPMSDAAVSVSGETMHQHLSHDEQDGG